jgi:hypothetical protein
MNDVGYQNCTQIIIVSLSRKKELISHLIFNGYSNKKNSNGYIYMISHKLFLVLLRIKGWSDGSLPR